MLCFAIGIASATWFIYSFVIIGTLIGATIGGLTSFLFLCVSIVTSLGVTLGGLPGFFCYCVSIGILLDAALGGLTGFSFPPCTLGYGIWGFCFIMGYQCVTGDITFPDSSSTSCLFQRRPLCLLVD